MKLIAVKKAFYYREPDYRDADYYACGLKKKITYKLGLVNSRQLSQDLISLAPGDARSAITESDSRQQMEDLLSSGSGFYERFKASHPHLYQNNKVTDYTRYFSEIRDTVKTEIASTKEFIERSVIPPGAHVSTATLIEYYMEKNNGNIGLSLADTYLFSKYMTRYAKENDWISNHIKDEFLGPNFNHLPAGKERDDIQGKWYHTLAFPNLVRYFPVEVVRWGGIARQILTFKNQGVDKTTSDLRTLADLRTVEGILLEYK